MIVLLKRNSQKGKTKQSFRNQPEISLSRETIALATLSTCLRNDTISNSKRYKCFRQDNRTIQSQTLSFLMFSNAQCGVRQENGRITTASDFVEIRLLSTADFFCPLELLLKKVCWFTFTLVWFSFFFEFQDVSFHFSQMPSTWWKIWTFLSFKPWWGLR